MSARSTLPARDHRAFAVALALALFIPGIASACEVRIGPLVASSIAYDPFGVTTGEGSIRTTVDLVSGDDCEATVALVDAAAAPLRSIRFGDAARPLVYRIEVQATDGVLAAGDYGQIVQAMLRSVGGADIFSARSTLMVRSIARAQANFAGTSSGFAGGVSAQTIDLGTLTTGEERSVILQVRANTVAHLMIDSKNGGYLVGGNAGHARIGYGLAIDGAPVALSAPSFRTIAPPLTIDGVALDLRVKVGDVGGMPAGRYSDTITVDVSP